MPTCRYCDEEFDTEDALLAHLEAAHDEDLGRVDRRRIEQAAAADTAKRNDRLRRVARFGVPILLGVAVIGLVYVLFFTGGSPVQTSAAEQPHDLWGVHKHGTMDVVILGEELDFSRARYQQQADAFHYEGNSGARWHVHARDVTLEWALQTLDIGVTDTSVSFEGTTYAQSDSSYRVAVTVNGEDIEPAQYVLQEGDNVRIVVERTTNATA
jgi:hypothetical protein